MKVLFDGYWWAEGPLANRTVQREIIETWAHEHPGDELVIALRRGAGAEDLPAGIRSVRTRLWPHAVSNRWELPELARRVGADVTIAHNYTPRRVPSIVFIHDVMFLDHPEWFSRPERLYFSPMIRWSRSADVVAASTATEARRIARHRRSSSEPVVVGLAVPSALRNARPRRPTAVPEDRAFAVTVGRLNVRKNLERLLQGAGSAARISPESPLYVVGSSAHSGIETQVDAATAALIAEGSVVLLGHLDDDELAWLYAHASLAITLSLDEGFGMPAIEASYFGAPLLASDISVFEETVGDYAHFVDPRASAERIAAAIDEAWGRRPPEARREAVRGRYRWEATVGGLRDSAGRIARP